MIRDDHDKRVRDAITWNTAINSVSMNVTSMEATLSISLKRMQLKKMNRHFLTGDVALFEQKMDPKTKEDVWYQNSVEVLEKHKREHSIRMRKLAEGAEEGKKQLRSELREVQGRIDNAIRQISEYQSFQAKTIPSFDPDAIGDIDDLKMRIKETKLLIRQANEGHIHDSYSESPDKRSPKTIKDILMSTSPKVPKVQFPSRGFFP